MQATHLRSRGRLKADDFIWASIGGMILGGLLFSFFQRPPLPGAEQGWTLSDLASKTFNAATQSPQEQQPWQIPSVDKPIFNLDQFKIPGFEVPQSRLEWKIQPEPCATHEYGNHWSGATGMNHCLVRVPVN